MRRGEGTTAATIRRARVLDPDSELTLRCVEPGGATVPLQSRNRGHILRACAVLTAQCRCRSRWHFIDTETSP